MKQVLISFVFVFAFAAVGFGAVDGSDSPRSDETDPKIERHTIYQTYKMCADAALVRQLGKDEVLLCNAAYLQLKLSFVEGASFETYTRLDAATRARVNRQGYAAYRAWVDERVIGLR